MRHACIGVVLLLCTACGSNDPEPGEPVPHISRQRDLNYQEFADYDEEDRVYWPPKDHRLDINEMP